MGIIGMSRVVGVSIPLDLRYPPEFFENTYDRPDLEGWMWPLDMEILTKWARESDSVIEIGSWKGKSTWAFLTGCPGLVYAVDHFHGNPCELEDLHAEAVNGDIYAQFMANVGHFPNLRVCRMDSIAASRVLPDADTVFLDGDHTFEAVVADLCAWYPKARVRLCGHDLDMDGVREALDGSGLPYRRVAGSIKLWEIVKEEGAGI